MPEFLKLISPQEALQRLLANLHPEIDAEWIEINQTLGRVTAYPVNAPHPLPSFPRSTHDGYAVRARDTFGASDSIPAYLKLAGEIPMGAASSIQLETGQCVSIHTGGMLPEGADAVVMLEYTQMVSDTEIEVLRPAAVGENSIKVGEDVNAGQEVIPTGRKLRPAEIGGLAALGITRLQVTRQPRVALISTGDEVIPPTQDIQPGQIRDVNTYTLAALVEQNGGIPVSYGILPDRLQVLAETAERAITECDLVIITAGSSASARDLTARVIQQLGLPGVLVHGVSIRPGKPTILGVCSWQGKTPKPVIGLPGNPVSALVIANLFVTPVIQVLSGLSPHPLQPTIQARLTVNVPSDAGREDWVPVKVVSSPAGKLAEPVFGKSNLIFTLVRADGLVRIPADANGLNAGDTVEVFPLL